MLTKEIQLSLEKDLTENYVENSEQYADYALNVDIVKESGKCFSKKETFSLEELVNEVGESFSKLLLVVSMIADMFAIPFSCWLIYKKTKKNHDQKRNERLYYH